MTQTGPRAKLPYDGPDMISHAPPGYACPFCHTARGGEGVPSLIAQADIVLQNADVFACIAPHWWPANPGHVLVAPVAHVENLYAMPERLAGRVHEAARRIALAMKHGYGCEGVSTRQHNEPAGNQDVWHYHLHVFPRWSGDDLYLRQTQKRLAEPTERAPYGQRLRAARAAQALA